MPNRWVSKHHGPPGPAHAARRKRSREGNVAILTALSLTLMMGFVALSFDIGNLYHVRTQAQSGVDAAALAGASALNGTEAAQSGVIQRAHDFAYDNSVYKQHHMQVDGSSVKFGRWDFDGKSPQFVEDTSNWLLVNAVRVTYTEPSVSLPFAAVMGNASAPVTTMATAVGGGPIDNACTFPMVVPDCAVKNAVADNSCSTCLKMAPSTEDNVAWTNFGIGPGNSPVGIAQAIEAACFVGGVPAVDPVTNKCPGSCGTANQTKAEAGVDVQNGNFFNSGNGQQTGPCERVAQLINRDGDASPKPFTVKVPVLVTNIDPANCGGAKLSGPQTISGFTEVDIYEVNCGTNGLKAKATLPFPKPDCGRNVPAAKYLRVALHRDPKTNECDNHPVTDHAGGPNWGVPAQPRLVE